MIRHYDKEKSFKKDHYISNKIDFMDIKIELKEDNILIEDIVKVKEHGIRKNGKKI